MSSVAVVGGGIFGVTAAVQAARAGYNVTLFESEPSLLAAASGINQYRLHSGYHYPRSPETASAISAAKASFVGEYGAAVLGGGQQYYAVAREGSRVSGAQFLDFCSSHALPYDVASIPALVDMDHIELAVRVPESRIDPTRLRALAADKLAQAGVAVRLGERATAASVAEFDKVVIAAYARTNELLTELGYPAAQYQFEVCEKPVVRMPGSFKAASVVVMDGPFMCVDPFGATDLHVLGNVVHAIHHSSVGTVPEVPESLVPLLNRGIVEAPSTSRFAAFIESGKRYIPALQDAVHMGSMYTVRTVLPRLDATDARPTLVDPIDRRVIRIFSGKIGNCVLAAEGAVALMHS